MKLAARLALIVLLAAPNARAGDIYVWRDHAGVSHYTTDLDKVPEEFRSDATTVAKEWKRADPPPEAVAVSVPAAAATTDAAASTPNRDLYEAAYLAGMRAAQQDRAVGGETTTNVVQSVQVQPESGSARDREIVTDRLVPVPVLVERRARSRTDRDRSRDDDAARDDFPPARRAPFLQGPAGPPPVSDR